MSTPAGKLSLDNSIPSEVYRCQFFTWKRSISHGQRRNEYYRSINNNYSIGLLTCTELNVQYLTLLLLYTPKSSWGSWFGCAQHCCSIAPIDVRSKVLQF